MSGVNGCDKHPDRVIDCCVECLKLELSGYIDTVKAMLFAARGGECDLATLEREMNAVSTKPSEYIRHVVTQKEHAVKLANIEISALCSVLSEVRENQLEINKIRGDQADKLIKKGDVIQKLLGALKIAKSGLLCADYIGIDTDMEVIDAAIEAAEKEVQI